MSTDDLNPKGYQRTIAPSTPDAWKPGRRSFFQARDLRIAEATHDDFGMVHAKLIGDGKFTGWHYHPGNLQIIYVLRGWIDLAFEDGRVVRLGQDACMNIPPGTIHNEVGTSCDYEVIELCSPSRIQTVNVPAPAAAQPPAKPKPTGPKPKLTDLYDTAKTDELTKAIDASSLPEAEKRFLRIAAQRLNLKAEDTNAVVEAMHFIQLLRLRHQHLEGEPGRQGDNLIDPEQLNELDRRILKESFRQARKLQLRLKLDYQVG